MNQLKSSIGHPKAIFPFHWLDINLKGETDCKRDGKSECALFNDSFEKKWERHESVYFIEVKWIVCHLFIFAWTQRNANTRIQKVRHTYVNIQRENCNAWIQTSAAVRLINLLSLPWQTKGTTQSNQTKQCFYPLVYMKLIHFFVHDQYEWVPFLSLFVFFCLAWTYRISDAKHCNVNEMKWNGINIERSMAFSHSTLLALLLYETKNNTMLMAFGNANNPSPKRKHTLRTEKKTKWIWEDQIQI